MEEEEWRLLFEGGKVKEKMQSWECSNIDNAFQHSFANSIPMQWSVIPKKVCTGVKAAAEERWRRIMEERRRRATEYSITVDKERGQVAQSMPHRGLCGIVRLRQL